MIDWSQEDDAQFQENRLQLVKALRDAGIFASPWNKDIWVRGPLSVVMEFCREWRSEIEELG
jgi:hypothetical protein